MMSKGNTDAVLWVCGFTVGLCADLFTAPYSYVTWIVLTIPFWIVCWAMVRHVRRSLPDETYQVDPPHTRELSEHEMGVRAITVNLWQAVGGGWLFGWAGIMAALGHWFPAAAMAFLAVLLVTDASRDAIDDAAWYFGRADREKRANLHNRSIP